MFDQGAKFPSAGPIKVMPGAFERPLFAVVYGSNECFTVGTDTVLSTYESMHQMNCPLLLKS